MKHLIIIFSFLSSFFSTFAQGDSAATRRKTAIENRARIRADSFNARAKTIWIKSDSFRIKADSFRFKANQKSASAFGYNNNYRIYRSFDSVVYDAYDKDTLVKEITTEVACNPDATIFIENLSRKLIIKTSADNKVKITTTVNYSADSKLTDAEWFQKLNLELKSNNNQVVLKSDNLNNGKGIKTLTITGRATASNTTTLQHYDLDNVSGNFNTNPVYFLDGNGYLTNKRSNTQKIVTIYIPANAKLDVESKYADVEIQNDLKTIKADITNASLRFMNVENVDIQGKYAKVNAGNIKKADIELNNGKFYGKNIYSAKFDSKYSNIEFGVINDLKIESNNDQYEIDEVTDLTAHKNYGNIRITNLKNSFNLTGNNADIKIRDIAAGVSNIKIDDKYADIRLPVNNLANYTVDFDGKNCNVYAPFEKVPVIKIEGLKPKEQPKQMEGETKIKALKATQPLTLSLSSLGPLTMTRVGYLTDLKDNAFKASVGDTKGKHAELQLICTNCTVDFK